MVTKKMKANMQKYLIDLKVSLLVILFPAVLLFIKTF